MNKTLETQDYTKRDTQELVEAMHAIAALHRLEVPFTQEDTNAIFDVLEARGNRQKFDFTY